jgi:hypothetical protein
MIDYSAKDIVQNKTSGNYGTNVSKVLGAEKTGPEYSGYRPAPINERTHPEIAIVLSTH